MNSIISVIITVVSPQHGRGVSEMKKDFKQYFGINPRQLIRIANDNNQCLFYAIELSRLFHDEKIINGLKRARAQIPCHLLTKFSFYRLLKNAERQKQHINNFLKEIDVDRKKESYGIDDLHILQEYYDKIYPGMYRIVVIDDNAKVLWKGDMDRKFIVALLYTDSHFDVLKNIAAYFKHKKFCIECQKFYNKDTYHRFNCKARCKDCGRVKNGQCESEADVQIECQHCLRIFMSKK